jgi:hypothetical protein
MQADLRILSWMRTLLVWVIDKIIVNTLPQILAGHVEPPGENVKKAQAWTKIPDASFVF